MAKNVLNIVYLNSIHSYILRKQHFYIKESRLLFTSVTETMCICVAYRRKLDFSAERVFLLALNLSLLKRILLNAL